MLESFQRFLHHDGGNGRCIGVVTYSPERLAKFGLNDSQVPIAGALSITAFLS